MTDKMSVKAYIENCIQEIYDKKKYQDIRGNCYNYRLE